MTETKQLLANAQAGFNTLNIDDKYKASALKWLEVWLTEETFESYVPQIRYLIEMEKWDFLLDSFYQIIPFGTGGRRGVVGIGPNRINTFTIQSSAQGHSQYLIKQYGDQARERGVVLTYDVRRYAQKGVYNDAIDNPVMDLDCKQLAIAAAEVYAANGIKVYLFDGVRSTPELSFAIRYLKAVAGDMFSASHNLPTDNGKKVYDNNGGQLIPPDDQILVDEVIENVGEIKSMQFDEALRDKLIVTIGEDVDSAFQQAAGAVTRSTERDINILYTPLHGTGLTSVYPVLTRLGFKVSLNPVTANLSGAFENVTFNIPNPEVRECFDSAIGQADAMDADLIISTDPDADRIGVMVKHEGTWRFMNGNEIGIVLTNYGISKYRAAGDLNQNSVVIKTGVTNSLIEQIAADNGVRCIGDLLVGFKYIGDIMNKLEDDGKIDDFILGAEESHGFIMGNYCRDKDAACAAVWIAEHAAELKKRQKTLIDDLDEVYTMYGYCHNYLTEIRLLGARGMAQIRRIMDHLRDTEIDAFGKFAVSDKADRWKGAPQPHLSPTDTASRNVLIYQITPVQETASIRVTVRPSGTEPKIKMYFEVLGKPAAPANLEDQKDKILAVRESLEKSFMQYCYEFLNIDFPERGYLLFWQLPLDDKLAYFEIEEDVAGLKHIPEREKRKKELDALLAFLGANPVEKVDDAFKARYGAGILAYLNIGASPQ